MKTINLKVVSSTNTEIKKYLSGGEDIILTAERQTGGMGTKGRSFLSKEGGLYISALTFYGDFPASDAFRVMTHAAVAVCRTAEQFGAEPEIKWANDVYVSGRKLCGILIENEIAAGKLRHSIVGIGVNVNNDLSALGGIAISLAEAIGKELPLDKVRDSLIKNLQKTDSFSDYLHYVRFLNKQIAVTEREEHYKAFAREVLPDGRLVIERDGKKRALSAAEISFQFTERL